MVPGAGVPSPLAAGVAGFESDAFSPLAGAGVGWAGESAGESFTPLTSLTFTLSATSGVSSAGLSSLADVGSSMRSLSLLGATCSVTVRVLPPADLRRLTDDLLVGAMVKVMICYWAMGRVGVVVSGYGEERWEERAAGVGSGGNLRWITLLSRWRR